MKYYKIILGLCEKRMMGASKRILNTGETLLFSGLTEAHGHHSYGVAPILSKEAEKAIIEGEGVSPRKTTAAF